MVELTAAQASASLAVSGQLFSVQRTQAVCPKGARLRQRWLLPRVLGATAAQGKVVTKEPKRRRATALKWRSPLDALPLA